MISIDKFLHLIRSQKKDQRAARSSFATISMRQRIREKELPSMVKRPHGSRKPCGVELTIRPNQRACHKAGLAP